MTFVWMKNYLASAVKYNFLWFSLRVSFVNLLVIFYNLFEFNLLWNHVPIICLSCFLWILVYFLLSFVLSHVLSFLVFYIFKVFMLVFFCVGHEILWWQRVRGIRKQICLGIIRPMYNWNPCQGCLYPRVNTHMKMRKQKSTE